MALSQYAGYLDSLHDTSVLTFRKVKQDSGYVGHTYSWQAKETLPCGSYAVKDTLSIETYGPRINNMLRLHFAPGTDIKIGDGISFDLSATTPQYTVVEAPKRKMQVKALIELIGVGNVGN